LGGKENPKIGSKKDLMFLVIKRVYDFLLAESLTAPRVFFAPSQRLEDQLVVDF